LVKSNRVEPFKIRRLALHQLDELHLPRLAEPLEHHVLEEVREPGAVLGLQAEPDPVIHADGHDRGGMVGRDDDAETVRQLAVLDRHS